MREEVESARKAAGESVMAEEGARVVADAAGQHAVGQS